MHADLKDSGLGEVLKIRHLTTNPELVKFLGRRVAYKRELLTPEFLRSHGNLVTHSVFTIRETQLDHRGVEVLRGYETDDAFGRCINPEHVYIVEPEATP